MPCTEKPRLREAGARSCGRRESGRFNQSELGQGGYAVIKAYLLDNLAIEDLQHRRAAKAHLATRGGRETANQKIVGIAALTALGKPI